MYIDESACWKPLARTPSQRVARKSWNRRGGQTGQLAPRRGFRPLARRGTVRTALRAGLGRLATSMVCSRLASPGATEFQLIPGPFHLTSTSPRHGPRTK